MAAIHWNWDHGEDGFREIVVDLTIHNEIGEFLDDFGIYLILGSGDVSGAGYYFGIQTDVFDPSRGSHRGEGLIYSRWVTRDLANARVAEDGWTESSGHEGDFIGVRREYDWGSGDYRLRLASDGADPDSEWFSLWITDLDADVTTWAGALKFPYRDNKALIAPVSYATIEIYGIGRIRPIDIPELRISVKAPLGDGMRATNGYIEYSPFQGEILNSEVWYDHEGDTAHLHAGGLTKRETDEGWVELK